MNKLLPALLLQNVSKEADLFISISIILLATSIALILFILLSRLYKSYILKKQTTLKKIYREIVYNLSVEEKDHSDLSQYFTPVQLKKIKTVSFHQQILIDELIHIRKNVVGTSAENVHNIYIKLNLHNNSLEKLNSISWITKARGIRELAEMNYQKASPLIKQLLDTKQQTIREESVLALIRLSDDIEFNFINDYKGEITPWMEINIHKHLATLDSRKLPRFSQWFQHPNASVSSFSIKMARLFRQTETIPNLIPLLVNKEIQQANLAAEAIRDMAGHEYADQLAAILIDVWNADEISIHLLHTLSNIGNLTDHGKFIASFMLHENYEVRAEAVRTLELLGGAKSYLYDLEPTTQTSLEKIRAHVGHPLLQ